jgi:hypothetical protein
MSDDALRAGVGEEKRYRNDPQKNFLLSVKVAENTNLIIG